MGTTRCPPMLVGGKRGPNHPITEQEVMASALFTGLLLLERFLKPGHGMARDYRRPDVSAHIVVCEFVVILFAAEGSTAFRPECWSKRNRAD